MKRLSVAALLAAALIPTLTAGAQTIPVVASTTEYGIGMAALTLPEEVRGPHSLRMDVRGGYFVAEGLQMQAEASVRFWPLGNRAPRGYGMGANALWFPDLGPGNRNMYLLLGGGVVRQNYPGQEATMDGLARVGFGVKLRSPVLRYVWMTHAAVEFRSEAHFADEVETTSGFTVGVSRFH
ncbi:MAG: hypothetical protein QF819_07575 [Gemmatimonadota bacterium]|jgi:hypothetical protein|nr:hypothetical protein [Gemmatimonadota bacterium]MDP6461822.1 hypothetical protein [Gemmatimonadota bacterium]MDP6528473.1 hypothetical protein [Gemmatimonadota bacterium]MDP6803018.1 hypothetical protein [Gemmatimonadota bacterium]MDP7032281.1 hypothetical protein [Gemmatimonadota bacterium]